MSASKVEITSGPCVDCGSPWTLYDQDLKPRCMSHRRLYLCDEETFKSHFTRLRTDEVQERLAAEEGE